MKVANASMVKFAKVARAIAPLADSRVDLSLASS